MTIRNSPHAAASAPVGRPRLLRPVALAGILWLFVAPLFGLVAIWSFAYGDVFGLFSAVLFGLLVAFGFGLITRRGIGLPLLSIILGSVLTMVGVLGMLVLTRHEPLSDVFNLETTLYGGVIVVSSAFGVWSARMDRPALRESVGLRILLALVVGGVCMAAIVLRSTYGLV
jgi:hypothetical protein